jgi:DNA-binding IclR family transcriptional regulator
MTMMVLASTDEAPELLALIEQRRARGLDRWDEWWEGVYRLVAAPTREHQRVLEAVVSFSMSDSPIRRSKRCRTSASASTRRTLELPISQCCPSTSL